MGFFTKLKNWMQGKGWHEDEEIIKPIDEVIKPPRKQKKKEEEIEITEKTETETKEEEKKEEKEEEKEEEEDNLDEIQVSEETKIAGKLGTGILTKEALERVEDEIEELRYKTTQKQVERQAQRIGRYSKTEKQIHEEINNATNELLRTTPTSFTGKEDGADYENMIYASIVNSGANIDPEIAKIIYENKERFKNRFTTEIRIELDNGETIRIASIAMFPNEAMQAMEETGINEGQYIDSNWWKQNYPNIQEHLKDRGAYDTTATAGNTDHATITRITYGLRFQ